MVVFAYPVSRRPRSGGDGRGSATARRARKVRMLADFPPFRQVDACSCVYCGVMLSLATIEADRIIPGSAGGTYRYDNLVPACRTCNASRGDATLWSYNPTVARRMKRAGRIVSAKSAA